MSDVVPRITTSLLEAPVPLIIEKLGVAIAEAQLALDRNSIEIARSLAETEVTIGSETHNLLSLGFQPSFYAFTEATVESKLSFSMRQETEFGLKIGVEAGGGTAFFMVAASVSVEYARKFSVSADGQSSIAARLVSLPPPQTMMDVLRRQTPDTLSTL